MQAVTNWRTRGVPRSQLPALARVLRCTVEELLGRPQPLAWPFPDIDQERFNRLSDRHRGQIERAILQEIERIEAAVAAAKRQA